MNNILVLGDGLLGTELVSQLQCDYISRKKDGIDFCDEGSYLGYLKGYDVIINCIGNVDTYSDDKQSHWDVNFKGVARLCDYCHDNNKKLVHISTDYLYANSKENASELDVPSNACNWYSYTKLLSDGYIQLKGNRYLLIRTSFKKEPFDYKYGWMIKGNFDYTSVIAEKIVKLIKEGCNGIYNVGTEVKSLYDLGKRSNPSLLPTAEYVHESVPKNVTMDISKMESVI
jgi:hypothetical protein